MDTKCLACKGEPDNCQRCNNTGIDHWENGRLVYPLTPCGHCGQPSHPHASHFRPDGSFCREATADFLNAAYGEMSEGERREAMA